MIARLTLTITAFALGAGIACATSDGANSLKSAAHDSTNAEIDEHSPTGAEIEAAEQGNPEDIGYKELTVPVPIPNLNADWESDDSGTPDEQPAQPQRR